MSADIDAAMAKRSVEAGTSVQRGKSAKPDLGNGRRCGTALNDCLVVQVRARPRWLRCALAPHEAEVSIFRPESQYHRLVFTAAEWDAFLTDVKAGAYDVAVAP